MTGKARWVVAPVTGVLALASIGATYENIALTGDATYVLVGHSTGGTYAMTYAAQYPEQVAGSVLDSSSPKQFPSPC